MEKVCLEVYEWLEILCADRDKEELLEIVKMIDEDYACDLEFTNELAHWACQALVESGLDLPFGQSSGKANEPAPQAAPRKVSADEKVSEIENFFAATSSEILLLRLSFSLERRLEELRRMA